MIHDPSDWSQSVPKSNIWSPLLYCILCIVLESDEISESPKVEYYSIADLNLTKKGLMFLLKG